MQFYVSGGHIEIRKALTLSMVKPRENVEILLTNYELFINGNIHYITNSFCNKVADIRINHTLRHFRENVCYHGKAMSMCV